MNELTIQLSYHLPPLDSQMNLH